MLVARPCFLESKYNCHGEKLFKEENAAREARNIYTYTGKYIYIKAQRLSESEGIITNEILLRFESAGRKNLYPLANAT